jgi:hypothetical protein
VGYVGFLTATRQGDIQLVHAIEERPPVLRLLFEGRTKLIDADRDRLMHLLVGGRSADHGGQVALLGGDEVYERGFDGAVGAGDGRGLDLGRQGGAEVDQGERRPLVMVEHCVECIHAAMLHDATQAATGHQSRFGRARSGGAHRVI